MIVVEAMIEEFEQGAWVADLLSVEQYDGSFDFSGETWTGAMVSERLEFERWHTRVVGGAGNLGAQVLDKFYSGQVSLQVAAQDVCRECSEAFGSAQPGVFLTTLDRLKGPARGALDSLALAFDLIWWVGRDGNVNVRTRPPASEAKGSRVSSAADSVLLVEPESLVIGSTYDSKPVRHIRWEYSAKRFAARVYFVPFVFRAPVETRYDRVYSALVDKDNGDGTIDVIADQRFGVTKVRLFGGVPGSTVKMNSGEVVMLGFFAGDPQKPYAMAMAQKTASKAVARKDDTVKVTIDAAGMITLGGQLTAPPGGGPCVGSGTLDITGTITSGSERLKVGD